jgi:ADP-heptose:LPS heptosyltransferase
LRGILLRMRYTGKIRFVDRYIGSCVLFFFTFLHRFRHKPADRKIKNVLVIELIEMGASIMGYSSLRYIKKQLPDAQIFCLCTESTKEPWLLLDAIAKENVFALDNSNMLAFALSIFKQTRALSTKNIDMVIDFELFTRISAIISFLVRSKMRAGFYSYTMGGLYRGNFLDVKCNFNQNMHIAKNLLALTKSALDPHPRYYNWEGPIPTSEIVPPTYRSDPTLKNEVKKKVAAAFEKYFGEPLMLVAPTVGEMLPMRDYPKEHYVEVIKKLLNIYPTHRVLLVGTSSHDAVAQYIEREVGSERCVNFCRQMTSLCELLELFSMADFLITNDSGNPHFAAMTGLKNIALYGPETPFMYGPLGKSVCLFEFFHSCPSITTYNHKNPPSDSNESLRSIHPDRVVKMAQVLMDEHANYCTVNNEIPYLL